MSLIQPFLALAFGASAYQVGQYSLLASVGCNDLRSCLVDPSQRPSYTCVLQLALANVVFNGGAGGLNCRPGLVNLRLVVVVLQFDEKVALVCIAGKQAQAKYPANKAINAVAELVGGKGGGRPDMAQAGGKNPAALSEALQKAPDRLASLAKV